MQTHFKVTQNAFFDGLIGCGPGGFLLASDWHFLKRMQDADQVKQLIIQTDILHADDEMRHRVMAFIAAKDWVKVKYELLDNDCYYYCEEEDAVRITKYLERLIE